MKRYFIPNIFFFFFSGWGVLALLLAWGGIFYASLFYVYSIVFILTSLFLYRYPLKDIISNLKIQNFQKINKNFKFWIVGHGFLFLLSLFLVSFFQPATYFAGRDEGSLFQASFNLAETHSLTFSSPEASAFFEIYGKGRSLNFPGFYYTSDGSLTTQFPIAYIAWLASFLTLFGLIGLPLGNGILLFLFFLASARIIRTFASVQWTLIGLLLLATSFPIFWFSRFTLSENFALAFLWVFIWTLTSFTQKPNRLSLLLLFLTGTLLLFGRIEGIAFLGMALLFLTFTKNTRTFFTKNIWIYTFFPLVLLLIFGILSLFINTPFYITIAKGFLTGSSEALHSTSSILSSIMHQISLFFLYGIGLSLLLGIAGLIILIKEKFHTKSLSLSLLITLPSFLYLFVSFISPDHPWMLRRFMFSIVPIFLFLSLFLCTKTHETRYRFYGYIFVITLFATQIGAFIHFFPFMQGKELLSITQEIARTIPEDELVLIDQLASGDGFHMLSAPLQTLLNRHAVYFMNPYDLDNLNLSDFATVSLLVPEGREGIYAPILAEHDAQKIQTFPISFSILENTSLSSPHFPKKIHLQQNLLLYRWAGEAH